MTALTTTEIDTLLSEVRGKTPSLKQLAIDPIFKPNMNRILSAVEAHYRNALAGNIKRCSDTILFNTKFTIKGARRKAGLTLNEVGKAIGKRRVHVSDLDNGRVLPQVEEFKSLLKVLKINRYKVAREMVDDFLVGRLMFRGYHLVAVLEVTDTHQRNEILWACMVNEWRFCFGEPTTFDGARVASSIKVIGLQYADGMSKNKVISYRKAEPVAILGRDLLVYSILTSYSPLSLFNYIIQYSTKQSASKLLPASEDDITTGTGFHITQMEFDYCLKFISALGLIPDWQLPLFNALLSYELSYTDDFDNGLIKYHQFPLTGAGLTYYKRHPVLGGHVIGKVPESFPTSFKGYNSPALDGEMAYQFLREQHCGYSDWQNYLIQGG